MKKIFLLCSVLFCSLAIAQNDFDSKECQEFDNAMEMISQIYESSICAYEKKDIETYENDLMDAMKKYLSACIQDKDNAKNISIVEKEVRNIISKLANKTTVDQAYAATSMMFSITLSKATEEIEESVKSEQELENLSSAGEQLSEFIEKFFLSTMKKA